MYPFTFPSETDAEVVKRIFVAMLAACEGRICITGDNFKIAGTPEAWEAGTLGRDKKHAQRVSADVSKNIDEALGLAGKLRKFWSGSCR